MNSLFDILTETICDSTLLEAVEDKNNPLERDQSEEQKSNHYLNEVPDEGWTHFWKRWGELSDEDFETEFGKSKEKYKTAFENEVRTAKQNAVKYYKDYYSEKNPDVIEKFKKRKRLSLTGDTLKVLHRKLDKLSSKDSSHELHYPNEKTFFSLITKKPSSSWGYVKPPKEKVHILLYNFLNPEIKDWTDTLYGVVVHEIGHIIDLILKKRLKKPYTKIKVDDIFNKKDTKKDQEGYKYIMNHQETYARIQNFRRIFDITYNISPEELANLWMDKVKKGEIKFYSSVERTHPNMPDNNEKFCCGGCNKENKGKDDSSTKPNWFRQKGKGTVTLELPYEYVQICICGENFPNNKEACEGPDLKFKTRVHLRSLWEGLTFNGEIEIDTANLLAKFTSKVVKKENKFYLTIDLNKIAQANEEFTQNEIGDDLDTQSV